MQILNIALFTLAFTLSMIAAISADGGGGCEAWSYYGTGATDSSSALADDCAKVADLFQHEWDMDKKKTLLNYTEANGYVSFEDCGTCSFKLNVSPGSPPVCTTMHDLSSIVRGAVAKYRKHIGGVDRVGAVGTWDCRSNHAQAVWWISPAPQ